MADRTWNRIDMQLFDEDLSVEALFVYMLLKTKCPNLFGIYRIPAGFVKRKMTAVGSDDFSLEPVLEELTSQNKIRLYGETIWIVEQFTEDTTMCIKRNVKAMYKFIADQPPELRSDFKKRYSHHFVNAASIRRARIVNET